MISPPIPQLFTVTAHFVVPGQRIFDRLGQESSIPLTSIVFRLNPVRLGMSELVFDRYALMFTLQALLAFFVREMTIWSDVPTMKCVKCADILNTHWWCKVCHINKYEFSCGKHICGHWNQWKLKQFDYLQNILFMWKLSLLLATNNFFHVDLGVTFQHFQFIKSLTFIVYHP